MLATASVAGATECSAEIFSSILKSATTKKEAKFSGTKLSVIIIFCDASNIILKYYTITAYFRYSGEAHVFQVPGIQHLPNGTQIHTKNKRAA